MTDNVSGKRDRKSMDMPGLLIPADPTQPVEVIDLNKGGDALRDLQQRVGGYVEVQAHDTGDLWVNEEGRINGMPVNVRVSHYVLNDSDWAREGIAGEAAVIYGDVVLTGPPERGEITRVYPEMVEYFSALNLNEHALDDWTTRNVDITVTEWDLGDGGMDR